MGMRGFSCCGAGCNKSRVQDGCGGGRERRWGSVVSMEWVPPELRGKQGSTRAAMRGLAVLTAAGGCGGRSCFADKEASWHPQSCVSSTDSAGLNGPLLFSHQKPRRLNSSGSSLLGALTLGPSGFHRLTFFSPLLPIYTLSPSSDSPPLTLGAVSSTSYTNYSSILPKSLLANTRIITFTPWKTVSSVFTCLNSKCPSEHWSIWLPLTRWCIPLPQFFPESASYTEI